jgi:ABC-type transport system substrate-binding protein
MGPTANNILRIGALAPLGVLDPRRTSHAMTRLVLAQVFEPLVARDGGGRLAPRLLAGLPTREGAAWRVRLLPGVRLSDGTELTASDVAHSLEGAGPLVGRLRPEVAGALELRLHPEDPQLPVPRLLASHGCAIVVERGGAALGTGAFKVVAHREVTGVDAPALELGRNPHHHRAVPLDGVAVYVLPLDVEGNPSGLTGALESRAIDFANELGKDEVEPLAGVRKLFRPGDSTCALFLNTARSPLDRREVRLALAQAVDRHALAATSFSNPLAYVAKGLIPPALGKSRDHLDFDPRAARSALAGPAAIDRPLRMLTVWAPRSYLPRPRAVADALARQLADVGVEVDIEPTRDPQHYFGELRKGTYDLVLGGWIADNTSIRDYFRATLHSATLPSSAVVGADAFNLSRWRDPAVDALLDRAAGDDDEGFIDAVMRRVSAEAPLVPIMHGPSIAVHAFRVRGLAWGRAAEPDFTQITLE